MPTPQAALNAVHAWGLRWFAFRVGPLATRPQSNQHFGVVLSPSLGAPTLTSCALVVTAFSNRPVLGTLEKVCSSLYRLCCVRHLRPAPAQLALRRWCRHLFGWPCASPILQSTVGDALRLALGCAFSLFGRLCATDHTSSRPPIPATVFRLCSNVQGTWSRLCASALHSLPVSHRGHVGISSGSPPSSVRRSFSCEANSHLDQKHHRLLAMAHDLHDVFVGTPFRQLSPRSREPSTVIVSPLLRCVCGALPTGDTTTPPLAVILATWVDFPPALCATALMAPSCITSLLAAWTHSCSMFLLDTLEWALHRWVFSPMDEANTPQSIRAVPRGGVPQRVHLSEETTMSFNLVSNLGRQLLACGLLVEVHSLRSPSF